MPSLLTVAQVHEPNQRNTTLYRRLGEAFIDFHDRVAPFYELLNAEEPPS